MKKWLFLLVSVALGTLIIACGGTAASPPASGPNTVSIGNVRFSVSQITIHKGSRLTFVEDPTHQALHILIIGQNLQQEQEKGAPDFGGAAGIHIDVGSYWTSPPWNTVGTFHVACSIHPLMNLMVIVV